MNYIEIMKRCYLQGNNFTNYKIDSEIINDNGVLKFKKSGNILVSDVYNKSNNTILDFLKYPAPYLETKLYIIPNQYYCWFNIIIKIKNVKNIINYLNHDSILRNTILEEWDYTTNRKVILYNEIESPIYKSKIKVKPSKNLILFDYQLNNIEIMNNKIQNAFEIPSSDKEIKLFNVDETEIPNKKIYFDNFNKKFTFKESFIKVRTKGLIIADEMGLGKTITTISYLKTVPRQLINENNYTAKGHLIIVPNHLAKQWYDEIIKVWKDAEVKLILTKRDHLNITTKDILDYDFVIVSQQFLINKSHYMKYPDYNCKPSTFNIKDKLSSYYNLDNSLKSVKLLNKPPLLELITWNNVVIDEGHEIMNSRNSLAMSDCLNSIIRRIEGNNYWFVSGTPYNNVGGYDSIMKFLRVEFYYDGKFLPFNKLKIANLIYNKHFVRNIMIRHTKKQVESQIDLKGFDEKIYWLTQTNTEKQIYEGSLKNHGRAYLLRLCCHLMVADLNSAIKVQTVDIDEVKANIIKQSEDKINKYTHYLSQLNQANQSYHMLKANYTNIISQTKFMLETIKKLSNDKGDKEDKKDKEDKEDNECPICIDDVVQATILPCGHVFCHECIQEMIKIKRECPLCKQQIKGDLIKVSSDISKDSEEKKDDLIEKYGVKTGTLIRLVRKIITNKDNNIIIFSQYDFMLKLVSDSLSKNGVNNSFVKGNVFQRNKAIESFRGIRMGDSSQVIMLSLRNAASGTHLVEANHIIFVEPIDSYRENVLDIENQAIARACRIGQKKKVHIHRLLVKNTVEEELYNKIYL